MRKVSPEVMFKAEMVSEFWREAREQIVIEGIYASQDHDKCFGVKSQGFIDSRLGEFSTGIGCKWA